MKPVRLSKKFIKTYAKRIVRNATLDNQYKDRVEMFLAGERGYPLNDHALAGKLTNRRAFSVNADIRVIYEVRENIIVFIDIGTHNQVY